MRLSDLAGKTVVVWGSGREAASTIRALRSRSIDANIRVVDEGKQGQDFEGIRVEAFSVQVLDECDVIVRSPGVSKYRDELQGRTVTTATNLWFAEDHAPVIAFTGTKGKSTSSSLTSHLLTALGIENLLAGNIGQSPLDLIDKPEPDFWVLEMSSFQTSDLEGAPLVGAITSFSPEHLDWHGSVDNYRADKVRLLELSQRRVINNIDDETKQLVIRFPDAATPDLTMQVPTSKLLGPHNERLIRFVYKVLEVAGFDVAGRRADLDEALKTFEPLPHRLQPVRELNGVLYVNDSLSTTPIATLAGIEAFAGRPVTVLVGGYDRGVSFETLGQFLRSTTNVQVITLPDSGHHIATAIDRPEIVTQAADLQQAVELAAQITPSGGVVLLSPGAASFGHFTDYADRGHKFAHFVEQL